MVTLTPSQLRAQHQLDAWVRAAVLRVAHPDVEWTAVTIGRGDTSSIACVSVTPRSSADARAALETVLDLAERARRSIIPASAELTLAIADSGRPEEVWRPSGGRQGDGDRPEALFLLGEVDLVELLDVPPLPDEHGPQWGDAPSRLERWAHRIWSAVERTAIVHAEVLE